MSKERKVTIPNCTLSEVDPTSIDFGTRFREDMGDLSDLIFSIRTQGLINPIAVMRKEDGGLLLVAGGRRLTACLELKLPLIPVRIFDRFDELDLRLLELAENMQRKDMTWQEQNRLQREIHMLQQRIHGEGRARSGEGWSLSDTAKMLGVSKATISESITLGDKLEAYKDVLGDTSRFKTENEARKAVKVVEEAMIRTELAKRAEAKILQGDFAGMMAGQYLIGDCLEEMAKMEPSQFDFAEVDPPYGIDLNVVKAGNDCKGYAEVEQDDYLVFTKKVMEQVYRLLKPNTFCLWWFGPDPWFEYIFRIAREVGFEGSRVPLVWLKPNGQSLTPSSSLASCYEMAFYLRKGSPILGRPGRLNSFVYDPVPPTTKHHPTQKPVELYKDIYETFSFEGANCLVPFAGSGASLVAAFLSGRKAMGWDLSPEYKGGYLQMLERLFLK